MICYRIELWCDGCNMRSRFQSYGRLRHEKDDRVTDVEDIPLETEMLLHVAQVHDWSIDDGKQFCEQCVAERNRKAKRRGVAKQVVAQEAQCH